MAIDGAVNLLLGVLLLCFPLGIAQFLGVPHSESFFYPTILGGVLIGIGLALLIERRGTKGPTTGLGLCGAVIINFCGAGVLTFHLVFTPLNLPLRGYIILWAISVLVFMIGIVELLAKPWKS